MQRHFGGHMRERFHLEVCRAHPRLDGPEWMFGGLAALLNGAGKVVEDRAGAANDLAWMIGGGLPTASDRILFGARSKKRRDK